MKISVWSLWRTSGSFEWAWIASDRRVWFRVWDWRADFWKRGWEEEKAGSKESSRSCSWELVALYSTLQFFSHISGSFFIWFQVMPKRFREFPEMKMYLLAWGLMGSWGGVRLLLPGAWYRCLGGPSKMSLRLSTVDVREGSCWSRRLMMIVFVFKWAIYWYCSMLTPSFYLISCLLDQFVTDSAATVIHVTGNQMVLLCRSVCEEEKAQLLSPLMNS